MEKPQAIEYKTPYKTVILSNPDQLVVKKGFKCINGGTASVNGKFSPLFVRYDNKPELTALIENWLEELAKYNEWYASQVALAKRSMTTNTPHNFDEAENADFSWSYWDGTSGKTLTEKATGREIYQMRYTGKGESVEGETRTKVMAFWDALEQLRDEPVKPSLTLEEISAFEATAEKLPNRNDHPGWCNHCHSYCYGDCQS